MYSLFGYRQMAADRVRIDAYAEALRRAVRPGCTVLDIGAGTGLMSILACRLGAGRVFAVEPARAIQLAREVAAENGCAARIEFFEATTLGLDLPARADVIVSDLRGILPLHERHLPSIVDARERLLAPGGTLIPLRDTIRGAVVEARGAYESYAPLTVHGVRLDAPRRLTSHLWTQARLPAEALLSEPQTWAALDYATVEEPSVRGTLRWTAAREGTAHGLCFWFEAELMEGVRYSTAPGEPWTVYGQGFFPFPDPVLLRSGDRVETDLRADLIGGRYVWSWNTEVRPVRGEGRSFQQSTFRGSLFSLDDLRRSDGEE